MTVSSQCSSSKVHDSCGGCVRNRETGSCSNRVISRDMRGVKSAEMDRPDATYCQCVQKNCPVPMISQFFLLRTHIILMTVVFTTKLICHIPLADAASVINKQLLLDEAGDKAVDFRSWWIPNRVPEYLTYNVSDDLTSTDPLVESPIDEQIPIPSPESESGKKLITPVQEAAIPPNNFVIQFTKYQQPEPQDPDGIRFPVTLPITRSKYNINSNIKPRFDNINFIKNSLLRWMNVH